MSNSVNGYSLQEEIFNAITHGVGVLLSIAGLGVLTAFASLFGNVWHIVSCSIYGTTLVFLYTASTLYHGIPDEKVKKILRVIDHSAIFLLIAGTYTPFTLVSLRGIWGWSLFGTIWFFAVMGIILQCINFPHKERWSLVLYLGMGWAIIVAAKPLIVNVPLGGLIFLLLGGLSYTIGVFFYVGERLKFSHGIWHLLILLGSVLHFFSILFYVIPIFSS